MTTSVQQNFYLSTAPFFQAENCYPNFNARKVKAHGPNTRDEFVENSYPRSRVLKAVETLKSKYILNARYAATRRNATICIRSFLQMPLLGKKKSSETISGVQRVPLYTESRGNVAYELIRHSRREC